MALAEFSASVADQSGQLAWRSRLRLDFFDRRVRPTGGSDHVIVNGKSVIPDGALVPSSLPGRPVRA
jgi:hypothetical protein